MAVVLTHWFREAVAELTSGTLCDLVLDPVGGDIFDESTRCVAFGGKLYDGKAFDPSKESAMTFAGQLLQILRQDDVAPSPREEQAMNAVMICQCLTEMRPACFSARVFGRAVNDVVAGMKAASSPSWVGQVGAQRLPDGRGSNLRVDRQVAMKPQPDLCGPPPPVGQVGA